MGWVSGAWMEGFAPPPVSQVEQDFCGAGVEPDFLQRMQQGWHGLQLQQLLVRLHVLVCC